VDSTPAAVWCASSDTAERGATAARAVRLRALTGRRIAAAADAIGGSARLSDVMAANWCVWMRRAASVYSGCGWSGAAAGWMEVEKAESVGSSAVSAWLRVEETVPATREAFRSMRWDLDCERGF